MTERDNCVQSIGELERWVGGFPGEHAYSTLDGLDRSPDIDIFMGAAERLMTQWQGNKFAGLVLYGTPGTGKTHAAIGLGRALHDTGADVHYRYVPTVEQYQWDGERTARPSHASEASVFPKSHSRVERNPKAVLILDDFKPEKQLIVARAVEAGAQYGGLVVITSNYEDPFKIVEPPKAMPADVRTALEEAALEQVDPERMQALASERQNRLLEISASLRSRIATGFKFIEFSGPDRRLAQSFWDD